MSDVESKMISITAKVLNIDESKITLESNFVSDLGTDSLALVELMMEIEAVFDCDIPDEDASKIVTVGDAVKYVQQKLAS